jgi:hypothetical protein
LGSAGYPVWLNTNPGFSLTREIGELRFGPYQNGWKEVLGAGLAAHQRPVLHLALSFFTWRTLTRESGMTCDAATTAMVQAIECAGRR